jgi:hypothetical protein
MSRPHAGGLQGSLTTILKLLKFYTVIPFCLSTLESFAGLYLTLIFNLLHRQSVVCLSPKQKVNRSRSLGPAREMALKGTVIAVMLYIKIKI